VRFEDLADGCTHALEDALGPVSGFVDNTHEARRLHQAANDGFGPMEEPAHFGCCDRGHGDAARYGLTRRSLRRVLGRRLTAR